MYYKILYLPTAEYLTFYLVSKSILDKLVYTYSDIVNDKLHDKGFVRHVFSNDKKNIIAMLNNYNENFKKRNNIIGNIIEEHIHIEVIND